MNNTFRTVKAENDKQIQEIAELAEIIWHEHFVPIIGKEQVEYMVDKFQSYHSLKEQIENGYEYYQIIDSDEFCGYCGIHQEDDGRLFLSKLYLKKEARGRHLASQAFEFLKALCKERHLSAIWLTCNKHNDGSLAVYRHFGFETIDTQEADIGNGFIMDDYIMEYQIK
ncbi:GNAT family N-acetyltransferase [Mediterraneibacter agrestimuris]|uniref:GNAT family N-acetyltransferase n=1 Tax=Mediterraneibacter agrestimuris TaxID=2941333 RepID=UPI00203AF70C|nr:GNAT family N-acetyltransferase [Mediterraneibacter agrestimuris]